MEANKVEVLLGVMEVLVKEETAALKRKDLEELGSILSRRKGVMFELFENTHEKLFLVEGVGERLNAVLEQMKENLERGRKLRDGLGEELTQKRQSLGKLRKFRDSYAA